MAQSKPNVLYQLPWTYMIRLFWDYKDIPSSIVDIDSSITHGEICAIKPYGKKPATFLPEYNLLTFYTYVWDSGI